MSTTETSVINTVKAWILPGIFAFAVAMLNDNLQEMKQDIKTLLAQSERDKVKIEYLEQEVQALRNKLDDMATNDIPYKENHENLPSLYAILPGKDDSSESYSDRV